MRAPGLLVRHVHYVPKEFPINITSRIVLRLKFSQRNLLFLCLNHSLISMVCIYTNLNASVSIRFCIILSPWTLLQFTRSSTFIGPLQPCCFKFFFAEPIEHTSLSCKVCVWDLTNASYMYATLHLILSKIVNYHMRQINHSQTFFYVCTILCVFPAQLLSKYSTYNVF